MPDEKDILQRIIGPTPQRSEDTRIGYLGSPLNAGVGTCQPTQAANSTQKAGGRIQERGREREDCPGMEPG